MVYFSGSIYTAFIETLTKMDLTEEQIKAIKASLCEITKLNPNRVRIEERIDDPNERARVQKQKYCDINREAIRERNRIYMRNKRAAARLAQGSEIDDTTFNGVVMV
jgi:hypothetical protein